MISMDSPLVLGSASPRRRALLEGLGIPIVVVAADLNETQEEEESSAVYLERIVGEKLRRVGTDARARDGEVVLAADTIVLLDGIMLGKPAGAGEARSMLTRLSGRRHEVRTRFALGVPSEHGMTDRAASAIHAQTVATWVEFRALDRSEIERYVATGEGADKAGAYAIQGVGSFAVRRIEGSYSNVVGLPVCEVVVALRQHAFLGAFP